MKKIERYYLVITFIAIIYLSLFMTFKKNYSSVSILENRILADIPEFSKEVLLNGQYFKQWETYLTDHIYGRNYWIKGHTFFNMYILGKKNVNEVVVSKEGTLLPFMPYSTNPDLEYDKAKIGMVAENISKLDNYINGYGGQFCFIGIPEQGSYLRDKYHDYYRNNEEYYINSETTMFSELQNKDVNYINMYERYNAGEREDYYFKTDHHYTMRGAYKAYEEIIQNLRNISKLRNITPAIKEDGMSFIALPNPILGSRNRKLAYLYPTDEKIEIAYFKDEISYEKYTNGQLDNEFYWISENEKERPTYGVFMGGDHAETVIQTNREELPNLLIFGDSFTNALEPLLYYHFNETRALDLRHYNEKSLYDYISEYKPDVVLMIRDDLTYVHLENGNGKFD